MKEQELFKDSDFLPKVIHNFIRSTSNAATTKEVFWAITKNFIQVLEIEDCVVYEAFPKERKIVQRAAHGNKNPNEEIINNIMELDYGVGIAGWVAENQKMVCLGDVTKDERYIFDYNSCKSEISVPILFNGELFGVIDSENSEENYYTETHIEVFQLIADLAASLVVRIRQKNELEAIKVGLEENLFKSNKSLSEAIEEVSDKISMLQQEKENRELLIKEVHHRVSNNLQILISMINIYLAESEEIDIQTLKEIQLKIQTLSSIHLLLLKSVEKNTLDLNTFLCDLVASIRYTNNTKFLNIQAESELHCFSMNTLIPLGLLINEILSCLAKNSQEIGISKIVYLNIYEENQENYLEIKSDSPQIDKLSPRSKLCEILIETFVEQLDGGIVNTKTKNILWKIKFQAQA